MNNKKNMQNIITLFLFIELISLTIKNSQLDVYADDDDDETYFCEDLDEETNKPIKIDFEAPEITPCETPYKVDFEAPEITPCETPYKVDFEAPTITPIYKEKKSQNISTFLEIDMNETPNTPEVTPMTSTHKDKKNCYKTSISNIVIYGAACLLIGGCSSFVLYKNNLLSKKENYTLKKSKKKEIRK